MRVESLATAGQQTYQNSVFPFVFHQESDNSSLDLSVRWVAERRAELLKLATQHGAVLLRDFGVSDTNDFDAIVAAVSLENFPYAKSLSNAVRINRTPRVFSANEAPPEARILFHHEMAQTPLYPKWILFSCEVAPDEGGATPLCRSDILYQRLAQRCPGFVRDCEHKGLSYTNIMPAENDPNSSMGRSWKSTLGVQTVPEVEARLGELRYSWHWLADDCLKATTPPLPGVLHLADGRKTFFNQLIAAFCGWSDSRNSAQEAIRHGDGSQLDSDSVLVAAEIAEELSYDHHWQVGDVVLVNNEITMHARRPFVGTRKVVASLAEMQSNSLR